MLEKQSPTAKSRADAIFWREGLLSHVGHVYVGIFVATTALSAIIGQITALFWFGVTLMLGRALAYLMARRGLPYRARAWAMVSSLVLASATFYLFAGLNPGPVLACAFCLLLTALLLGRLALVSVLGLMVFFLLGITLTIWAGLWQGPLPAVVGVPDPIVWLRTTVVSAVFWSGIGFSALYVVSTIEQNVVRLREKEEQRRSAEKARREAEAIAVQSQKLDAIGQLAAGVAHDFNNALLVMRGWNDILRDSDSPETKVQAYNAIDQAIDQSEHLAKQLLAFGRKQMRAPHYLAIAQVVENTAETLGRIVSSRVVLRVESRQPGFVLADENQLQQLLFNLVLNARDALTDGGEIHVRLREPGETEVATLNAADHQNWIVLEVEDNGIGMDEKTRRRIFEPFFTTKESGKGTGLGLSTVFGIVQQSDAHIRVWSEPGRGTRFTIFFPTVEWVPTGQTEISRPGPSTRQEGRILVLEDDPLSREFLTYALKQDGFAIIEASNGTDAVELLARQNEPIDILSTDAVFPGTGLNEVIAAFKQSNPHGQVLVCSGYVPEDFIIQGVESGLYEFLQKPFSAEQLTQKIHSMLSRSST